MLDLHIAFTQKYQAYYVALTAHMWKTYPNVYLNFSYATHTQQAGIIIVYVVQPTTKIGKEDENGSLSLFIQHVLF